MAKLTDDDLLGFLEAEQADAFQYNNGHVASSRTHAMRDYLRFPYGSEQDGRSQVVTSDVFDTVEGILPDLIDVFVSSDKAVIFDPVRQEDEQGAKQATDACNYVFYKQNNGFLILYSAGKDALLLRTGGVKWWWDVRRTPSFETLCGTEMQIAMHLMANPKAEVVSKEEMDPEPLPPEVQQQIALMQAQGMQVPQPPARFKIRIKTVEEKGQVRLTPIPADELEVSARHNSILLDDCPYICHKSLKTLSDIHQLGFPEVTLEDVQAAREDAVSQDREFYDTIRAVDPRETHTEDSMQRGWLREEYILIDYDGDGIAERRKIIRLGKKILENEEFSHVPISAWTPYILTHKFDGLSVWDLAHDLQRISTEIVRAQIDNLALANNQESVVLTDGQGNPKANIDDLLNRRPGGVMRESVQGAIRPYVERWQGIEAMPMLEMLAQIKEKRTGYSPVVPGLDADALNKTATEVSKNSNERQKRMKLMARIMAEALVKPMFRGIFKTLTDYCMEPVAFRLNGSYVKYDPQEWRDGYDMTINVGLGTGDVIQQTNSLHMIAQAQGAILQSPFGSMLLDAEKIYNVQARIAELSGHKNPNEFWNAPKKNPDGSIAQPPQQPPMPLLLEQAKGNVKLQTQAQQNQLAMAQHQAELQVQAANDARDSARDEMRIHMDAQAKALDRAMQQQQQVMELNFKRWAEQLSGAIKIEVANISSTAKLQDAATQAATADAAQGMQGGAQ